MVTHLRLNKRIGPKAETVTIIKCNGCTYLDVEEDDWGVIGALCKRMNTRIPHESLTSSILTPTFCPFSVRKTTNKVSIPLGKQTQILYAMRSTRRKYWRINNIKSISNITEENVFNMTISWLEQFGYIKFINNGRNKGSYMLTKKGISYERV